MLHFLHNIQNISIFEEDLISLENGRQDVTLKV